MALDRTDLRILDLLQTDADASIAETAEQVNLSQNACWRRIKQLEASGHIRRRVALLDPDLMGCGVTVFVMLRAAEHSEAWSRTFADTLGRMPEVVEAHRLSGEVDYLLKLRVADIGAYDAVYKRLIAAIRLSDVSSAFVMEEMKSTTALPLPDPARQR